MIPAPNHVKNRTEAKLNAWDRSGNFTLGLGVNTVRMFVVDTTHDEPWVLNTYTLLVRRLRADHGLPPFSPTLPHVVCSLKQVGRWLGCKGPG